MTVDEAYRDADKLIRKVGDLKHTLAFARFDEKHSDSEKSEFLRKILSEAIEDIADVQTKIFGVNGNEEQTQVKPRIL